MASICRNSRKRKLSKKNPTIEDDTSNLPCEIIENILSRLLVKFLIRFKSVSKPWNSLISDAKFARFHLNQSKNSDSKTLYLLAPRYSSRRAEPFVFLKFTNQNFQIEYLEFPLKKYREAYVLCSCDGLVILNNRSQNDNIFILWNPSTRTYTKFSCNYPMINNHSYSYGLCYDATSDDYKFVLSISNTRYAVFSCKNKSWIEKEDHSPARIMPDPEQGLFVNGALYWLATKSLKNSDSNAEEDILLNQLYYKYCFECCYKHYVDCPVYKCSYNYTCEICWFDPRDDKFKKLCKPSCFDISFVFNLTDLGGQLCLYRNTYDYKMVEIWRMKDCGDFYYWTKLLTIENVPAHHNCGRFKPLCFINESNIVFHISGVGIFVYNPEENNFHKLISDEGMYLTPIICWNDSLIHTKLNITKRNQNGHL